MEGSWLEPGVARVLSAVVKLHTALVAVTAIREGLECFGGAGYMEVCWRISVFKMLDIYNILINWRINFYIFVILY